MTKLSVVAITKNQEWNVNRLISSILAHTAKVDSVQVILVDSASTDGTIAASCNYPITVIQLDADQPLSAAAGRYVGFQHVHPQVQFTLFLDGDMELIDGWVETALQIMADDPEIAVIAGEVIDRPLDTPPSKKMKLNRPSSPVVAKTIKYTGGAAMYRRSALHKTGGFNPFIVSDEEPELCIRIRNQGYRIARINRPITFHYTDPRDSISTLFGRRRRNLYVGAGQNLRYRMGTPTFWPYLRERGFGILPLAGVGLGVVAAAQSLWSQKPDWFGGWLLLLISIVGADALRKRSVYKSIYSLTHRLFIAEGTVRGFLMPRHDIRDYPARHRVIQQTPGMLPVSPPSPIVSSFSKNGGSQKVAGAVDNLRRFLVAHHWKNNALIGPDPGLRFNYRIFRFIKGYFPQLPWNDDLYYLQCQAYWIMANWKLFDQTGQEEYRNLAVACSNAIVDHQRSDGAWDYPNPDWSGRIATTEGGWASIGLLETVRHTGDERYLDAVKRWHSYMTNVTGFQAKDDTLAVNYFADRPGLRVPNNSALVLRLLAEMADVTGDVGYRAQCEGLLKFMLEVQLDTGEIPYGVKGLGGGGDRIHFQCYQYNAFQTIYLMRYYELTGDVAVLPAIQRVLDYLTHGMDKNGRPYFDCSHPRRAITYHASALGHTFLKATQMGFGDYLSLSDRAFGYTLRLQKPNGSFPHSKGDYAILQDHRAYPRYLAMILFHLIELAASQVAPAPASVLHPTARG